MDQTACGWVHNCTV